MKIINLFLLSGILLGCVGCTIQEKVHYPISTGQDLLNCIHGNEADQLYAWAFVHGVVGGENLVYTALTKNSSFCSNKGYLATDEVGSLVESYLVIHPDEKQDAATAVIFKALKETCKK
jgi:hypothetical protein